MIMKSVHVQQFVEVTADESKFTPEFLAEFRKSMYPFNTLDDHLEHLAQLHARGIADDRSFIEGYGWAKDMGLNFKVVDATSDIETR